MPRKHCPFTPLAPLAPPPPSTLQPRIKLGLTNISSILSTSTLKPSNIPSKPFSLTSCPKIDIPKSKKAKIGKLEIEPTPPPLPPAKIISYSIEFHIYLDKVKRITQAFLVNLLIRVYKTR